MEGEICNGQVFESVKNLAFLQMSWVTWVVTVSVWFACFRYLWKEEKQQFSINLLQWSLYVVITPRT